MKAAHQGVPVAGLPGGDWRNPDVSGATASSPQVSTFVGAPLTINRGGEAVLNAPAGRGVSTAASNAPVPPASIPNVGAGASVVPPPRGNGFLDKLFGAI
jgi:hypothetical protein